MLLARYFERRRLPVRHGTPAGLPAILIEFRPDAVPGQNRGPGNWSGCCVSYYGFPVAKVLQVFDILLAVPPHGRRPASPGAGRGRGGNGLSTSPMPCTHWPAAASCEASGSVDDSAVSLRRSRQLNLAPRLL